MNKTFSFSDRKETISHFITNDEVYDLLIVGGGITGAGVARDAASRGMKVALVEANDFSYGTSSRSTKLIHGGLRYLENFEFKLVFEALSERQLLFEIAPHLVHPIRFVLPLYKSSRVGMFKMGCGMWLYDLLSMFRGGVHERLSKKQALERAPYLKEDGLLGAYVYSDAYMDDDRLVFETLRSANDHGAKSVNYAKAQASIVENGKIIGMSCEDVIGGKKFQVKAKHVISSVGPWTDIFAESIQSKWKKILNPSKGVHLTISKQRFPAEEAVVLSDDEKSRIVFVVPRNDMVVLGTTDDSYRGDPAEVRTLEEDVDYLVEMLNSYFPKSQLKKEDFIASYAGVRPLVKTDEGSVGKTSREHTVLSFDEGITFVAGGKYTTYRKMAEDIVEKSLKFMPDAEFGRNNTKTPLNPQCSKKEIVRSEGFIAKWAQDYSVSEKDVRWLWVRFGAEAECIVKKMLDYREHGEAALWMAEAHHAIQNTMCLHLLDFYTRRTPLFLGVEGQGFKFKNEITSVFVEELSWSEAEKASQLKALNDFVEFELSWKS